MNIGRADIPVIIQYTLKKKKCFFFNAKMNRMYVTQSGSAVKKRLTAYNFILLVGGSRKRLDSVSKRSRVCLRSIRRFWTSIGVRSISIYRIRSRFSCYVLQSSSGFDPSRSFGFKGVLRLTSWCVANTSRNNAYGFRKREDTFPFYPNQRAGKHRPLKL